MKPFLLALLFSLAITTNAEARKSVPAQLDATLALGSMDGELAFGPGFHAEWPVTLEGFPFSIGFQTGFYFSSFSRKALNLEATRTEWTIPVLLTGKYWFENNLEAFKPYFGLAMGLGFDRISGEDLNVGTIVGVSETKLRPAFLAKPGATFGTEKKLFFEIPFGMLLNRFTVLVALGYHFDPPEGDD